MGVITIQQLDTTELTEAERDQWRPKVRESVGKDYEQRLTELLRSGEYPKTDEGWRQIKERAWAETIENNELCRAVCAISARRRMERVLSEGRLEELAMEHRTLTIEEVETMIRALNPDGALLGLDGEPMSANALEDLCAALNDPEKGAAALQELCGQPEQHGLVVDTVGRLRAALGTAWWTGKSKLTRFVN